MSKKKPLLWNYEYNITPTPPPPPPNCRFCHGAAPEILFADWDFPVCWNCADYLYSLPPPIAAELYRRYTAFWEENGTDKAFDPVVHAAHERCRRHGPPPMPRGGPRNLAELIGEIEEAREASSILEILAYSDETRELLRDLKKAENARIMVNEENL